MCILCNDYVFFRLNVLLIFVIGIFNFASKILNDGICVVALAPAVKTMSGTMYHPLDVMLLMSG